MIVALAVGLALGIQAFVVKPYQIPSPSMEPTLDVGQRVLVNRLTYRLGADPGTGDVVVFHPPSGAVTGGGEQCGVDRPVRKEGQACPEPTSEPADENFIKRVVAEPGDRLKIQDGIPIVNGEPVEGDWQTNPCNGLGGCDFPTEITIPPDHYFMMGDNRGQSDDSRYWGPVPREWIIGAAFATYWPPDRIGIL
ncbi:MAG TPA: signal peptidase I [Solirubrobacterales bacterium]|nr:signal peptidase I [Solirubrobacterales bacterium]